MLKLEDESPSTALVVSETLDALIKQSTKPSAAEIALEIGEYEKKVSLAIVIQDESQYAAAGELEKQVTAKEKSAEKEDEHEIDLANQLHKSLTQKRAARVAPWTRLKDMIKRGRGDYRKRKEDEERQRLQAIEAERRKVEEDARRQQEELDRQQRELARRGQMEQARQVEATKAAVVEQARQVTEAPVVTSAPLPKTAGLRDRDPWVGVCDDEAALMKAVVEGKIPRTRTIRVRGVDQVEPLFIVNERVLNHAADSMREEFNWPGCHAEKSYGGKR